MNINWNFKTVRASSADIPLLVSHHRRMFMEIFAALGRECKEKELAAVDQAYEIKLKAEISSAKCAAWLGKVDDAVIGSGAVSILSMVPMPDDPNCSVAYLHSIFTEKAFRGNGCAQCIIEKAEAHCREQGIGRIILNASAAGRPLYESLGFRSVDNSLRKWLK